MSNPFEATASVSVKGGLVCIVVRAPSAPETVLRMPRSLAIPMARQILRAADNAGDAWVTKVEDGTVKHD